MLGEVNECKGDFHRPCMANKTQSVDAKRTSTSASYLNTLQRLVDVVTIRHTNAPTVNSPANAIRVPALERACEPSQTTVNRAIAIRNSTNVGKRT